MRAAIAFSTSQALLWLLWPLWVLAVEQTTRVDQLRALPAWMWAAVAGASLLGFLISSAEDLFGWLDDRGARALGSLVKRFAASIAAGLSAYLLAVAVGAPEILALVGVTPAAYAGESYIRKLADKKADNDAGRIK